MRIRLFDPTTLLLLQDRLVEQTTEFSMGPKEKHTGPMSLELNLNSKEEVEASINYLKKLALDLPIDVKTEKKSTGSKKLEQMLSDKEPLLDLKNTVLSKAKTQEDLIKLLRTYEFRFTDSTYLADFNEAKPGTIEVLDKHKDYQFMARLYKEAKDPINDKWDMRLVFAIKIRGEKVNKVKVYLWGKFESNINLKWENDSQDINFKVKEKFITFPEFMDYDMRKKFRLERKKLNENPELVPSKFYEKWAPYVKVD